MNNTIIYSIRNIPIAFEVVTGVDWKSPAKRKRALLESNSPRDNRMRQRQIIASIPRKARSFRGSAGSVNLERLLCPKNSGGWGKAPVHHAAKPQTRKVHFPLNQDTFAFL